MHACTHTRQVLTKCDTRSAHIITTHSTLLDTGLIYKPMLAAALDSIQPYIDNCTLTKAKPGTFRSYTQWLWVVLPLAEGIRYFHLRFDSVVGNELLTPGLVCTSSFSCFSLVGGKVQNATGYRKTFSHCLWHDGAEG